MRKLLLAALLPLGIPLQAQTLTSLTVAPNPPTECQRFILTINGTLPQNADLTVISFPPAGPNEVNIRLDSEGNTGGGQPAFSYPFQYGPLTQGTWTLTVFLYLNNSLADTETITIDVIEQGPIDIGLPGERVVCNSDAPFPLFDVIEGTPTPGGEWLDPNNELVEDGMFVPGTSIAGIYLYRITLSGPCETQYQAVTVSYTPNASAGYGGTVQACSSEVGHSVDLFEELNGDPDAGGAWTGPSILTDGTYVPGVSTPGQYVYTVQGTAPCGNPTATITIQTVMPSNAGTATPFSICENDPSENLSQHVTGEQTSGDWWNDFGFIFTGYNQATDITEYGVGTHNFYYIIANPSCGADTATLQVTVVALPCAVGIDETQANVASMSIRPNPATDEAIIEADLLSAENSVGFELIGVDGRMLRSASQMTQGTAVRWAIEVGALAPGAYVVRLRTATGTAMRRLIVQ